MDPMLTDIASQPPILQRPRVYARLPQLRTRLEADEWDQNERFWVLQYSKVN